MNYVIAIVLAALGVAGVVLGELDDSPGLQVLGALLVLGVIAVVVRKVRHAR